MFHQYLKFLFQVKTLLFTGGYKKHGQTELLDKLYSDWIDQGKKVTRINMDLSKVPNTVARIQKELNQHMEEALKEEVKPDDELTDLLEAEMAKPEKKEEEDTKPRKISDKELFNLIDSMYEKEIK